MTVLIVDDEPAVLRFMAVSLQTAGYEVLLADGGDEALAFCEARAYSIDLMISDVAMPGLTGLDLQQRLIDDGKHVPIIFMTAYFSQPTRAQALVKGAVGFLGKPYREKCLIRCLSLALNRSLGQSSE